MINFNKQRDKNYSQKYNEAKELEIIETEKAKLRQIEKLKKGNEQNSCSDTQTFAEREKGETKQIVAKKTGFGSEDTFLIFYYLFPFFRSFFPYLKSLFGYLKTIRKFIKFQSLIIRGIQALTNNVFVS